MSLKTPILTTPSVYWAKAELVASSAAIAIRLRVVFMLSLHAGPAALRILVHSTSAPVIPGCGLLAREPAIHNHRPGLWMAGSPVAAPRNDRTPAYDRFHRIGTLVVRQWHIHSDAEIFVQLVAFGVQFPLGKAFDHTAVLHDIVAVRDRRGEMEILLDQHDGEALRLEGPDGAADLLDDHRRQTLGWLIKQ